MKISASIRYFLVFFLFSFLFILMPAASFAQEKTASASSGNITQVKSLDANMNPAVPKNLHNWTQTVMLEVMSAMSCQITGIDPMNPKQACLGADQKSGKIGFLPSTQTGGAIGTVSNMISSLYVSPFHTSDYFQYLSQNFGINKHAYAATGTGFDNLRPLMKIWVVFRNIAYLILVVVFVIIGLAIMLRVKIDPRTVMTIQNQIPKVIVGILAITFSFAIAGFLIDIMWVLVFLTYNILTQAAGFKIVEVNNLQSSTAVGFLGASNTWSIIGSATIDVGKFVGGLIGNAGSFNGNSGGVFGWLNPANWIMTALGGLVGVLAGVIAFIVIGIALLVALFKLWFALIKAYIMILVNTILAPFWFIGGIIPGSPISLSGWLKDMAANLLAFPATIGMFMLAMIFREILSRGNAIFVPPLIGNPASAGMIGSLAALGIILITPNVVDILKKALKAPKTDTGLSKAVGAGNPMNVAGGVSSIGNTAFGMSHTPGINRIPWVKNMLEGKK
jgi:hypothetical protein